MCEGASRLKALLLVVLMMLVSGSSLANAKSSTHYFRYKIINKLGDLQYSAEISASASITGTYYKIEADKQGRVVQVTEMRGSIPVSATKYHFAEGEKLANAFDNFTNEQRTGSARVQRTLMGSRKRVDWFNSQGDLTSYSVYEEARDHVEKYDFDAVGNPTSREDYYFTRNGKLSRQINYVSDSMKEEHDIDERKGLLRSATQFVNGQITNTRRLTYTADGDPLRADVYDADGKWFAGQEYTDGNTARRFYKLSDGTTKEIRYKYDANRELAKAEVYFENRFVCGLTYDRESDGTIKRTLALGPQGELWAEYAAPLVIDIQRNGQPAGRSDGIMYKTGNWW